MRNPDVVVAGCGAITAVGQGIEALRAALISNRSGLQPSARFDDGRFQSNIVGELPAVLRKPEDQNPAHRLATEALREALAGATQTLQACKPRRIGLVLSTTKANIEALERVTSGRECSDRARQHLEGNLLANDLAAEHGARGPIQCVSVACVSGLIALQQGARIIQRGDADAVMVVGVDHLSAFVMAGFSALKALDPMGCRPFDRDRRGLSPGEAGAAIILARSGSAPLGTPSLLGWGSTNDANHMTGPSRDGSGLTSAIHGALRMADVRAGEIDYINAHGTGTPYNDAMESMAFRNVFGDRCPALSASKGMLGHTLGAAGIVETVLCVTAMETGILPGTPGLSAAAEGSPTTLLREPVAGTPPRFVLKVNTGFGGANGALVLGHV